MSDHPGFRKSKPGETTCAACRHSWSYFKGGKTRYRCLGPSPQHVSNYTVPWGNTCHDARVRDLPSNAKLTRPADDVAKPGPGVTGSASSALLGAGGGE